MLKVGWRNLIKSAVSFSSNWSGVRSDSLLIVGKSKIWASSLTSSSSSSSSTTESSSWMMLQKKEKKKKSINSFSIHIFPDILKSTVRTLISRWHIWVHSPILIPPFINLRIIELIIPRSEIKEASGTEKKKKMQTWFTCWAQNPPLWKEETIWLNTFYSIHMNRLLIRCML